MPTIGNPSEVINDSIIEDFSKKQAKGGGSLNQYGFGQYAKEGDGYGKEYSGTVSATEVVGLAKGGKEIFKVYQKAVQYKLQSLAKHSDFGHQYFGNKPPKKNNILRSNYNLFNTSERLATLSFGLNKVLNLISRFVDSGIKRIAVFAKQYITKLFEIVILNANITRRHLGYEKMNDASKSVANRVRAKWVNLAYQNLISQRFLIEMVLYSLENGINYKSLNTSECYASGAELSKLLKEIGLKK